MIARISGKVVDMYTASLVVDPGGGIGYEVHVPAHTLRAFPRGAHITLSTYFKVSESTQELYGFQSVAEREFFMLLLSVSGVGSKTAMHVLSLGSLHDIQDAIARGDVNYLTAVQGIGKKTAERMVVELKSKIISLKSQINDQMDSGGSGILGDVVEGLITMGYTKEEAREAVKDIDWAGKTTQQLLRSALSALSQ